MFIEAASFTKAESGGQRFGRRINQPVKRTSCTTPRIYGSLCVYSAIVHRP